MKEEHPRFNPPAKAVTKNPSTIVSDEIFSTLLKINNFDSISSIKDESLDIDLSACVTIHTDPLNAMCGGGNGGNSMSSDFWRVLDENAQNVSESDAGDFITEQMSFRAKLICPDQQPPTTFSLIPKSSPPACYRKKSETSPKEDNFKKSPAAEKSRKKTSKLRAVDEQEDQSTTISKTNNLNKNMFSHSIASIIKEEPLPEHTVDHEKEFNFQPPAKKEKSPRRPPSIQFKCKHCSIIFRNQKECNVHEAAFHKIIFKCIECDQEFGNESDLKKHIKTHRTLEARKDVWKKCPDCGKCLKLGSMWMHRKIHSDNKKYACDICGQKFVQKINLTHHTRVHTSEKPFECPECQKRFQERSHLQRHQKYHAQTRSYRCDKCGKMYKTERCLKVHNLVHLEQRPFACQVCEKSFISNSKLKQHSNIHTGERPFKCNYCPRDFTNFPNWLKHTRRRHKVDHKTGEQLENIPSYCSKKSAVVPAIVTSDQVADLAAPAIKDPSVKLPRKRKKKAVVSPIVKEKVVTLEPHPKPHLPTPLIKAKIIPERNPQVFPQVIKQEPLTFPDLHCLSITSAEQLIMEQALEMEECGFFDPQTVQALQAQSDAATALYLQIKRELPDIKQEYEFKHPISSSLESSPFSSPASIEYTSSSFAPVPAASFYMPSFTVPIGASITTTSGGSLTIPHISTQITSSLVPSTPQPLMNHLYLPMTMRMTVPVPQNLCSNQTLPSVDTLLFNTNYFNNSA